MTSNPSTSGDDWESSLTQAFGVLLDRPLSDFPPDADYAVYYSGNWLHETEVYRDPAWLAEAVLTGRETITSENLMLLDEVGYPELRFDASRSLFEIDPSGADFPAAFLTDLVAADRAAVDDLPYVLGADLARLTARHGVDLTSPELPAGVWCLAKARINSNGTLLDALRVATGIGDGPHSLVPCKPRDAETEAAIAAVEHAGLRAHLRAFCDSSSHDLRFFYDDIRDSRGEDDRVVAEWEGAVDQFEITVEQIGR
ncbi:hypothetical protein [Streptomyces sp. NPDC059256]|uniref:hypothetical protein n=1 Tax=Streptomyces sp. NPDC059256 TaxID=3346794 RepID=UPI003677DEBA